MKQSARVIAAALIAGSALFGMSPVANADETSGPVNRTTTSQESRSFPEPPASMPKWAKRVIRKVNSFLDRNRGPFERPRYEPGKTNIVCRIQNKC